MPLVLLVLLAFRSLNALRVRVFHFEPVHGLAVLAREVIGLALPFVKLTKRHRVATECRKAAAVFENRMGEKVRIKPARRGEFFGGRSAAQLLEQRSCFLMIGDALIHACKSENFFGIIQASMRNVAHEGQNHLKILSIDVVAAFHPLADEP